MFFLGLLLGVILSYSEIKCLKKEIEDAWNYINELEDDNFYSKL